MGDLYRRGGVYWGRYHDARGRRRRASLKTKDRAVARQRLRDLELAGGPHRAADRSLRQALTHLLDVVYAGRNAETVTSYRQKARHIVRVFGDRTDLVDIDRAAVHGYRATRLEEGAKDHSIHKELVVLRLALREQGIEGVVPRTSAHYTPRDRFLTLAQFRAVMDQLPAKRRLWFMAACFLGARDSELAKLRWEDVDLRARVAHVRGTKTKGADRLVPIHSALMPELRAARRDSGLVIERWTNRRRDVTAAWWRVIGFDPGPKWSWGTKRGGKSLKGAPRISPNDLRRTFISWLKQQGVDSLVVAQIAGTGVRMVERVYGRLTQEQFREAVKKLPPPTAPRGRRRRPKEDR